VLAGQPPLLIDTTFFSMGVENDNYLVTGPLVPVAPEAVQEYRISTKQLFPLNTDALQGSSPTGRYTRGGVAAIITGQGMST